MLTNEATRAYLYRVAVALIPILVVAGYVAGDQAQLWLGLAAAVLGVGSAGLAARNTSTDAP